MDDDRVSVAAKPAGLKRRFRALTRAGRASPKTWANAYRAAFADTSPLTLVTFDRALRGRVRSLILLEE